MKRARKKSQKSDEDEYEMVDISTKKSISRQRKRLRNYVIEICDVKPEKLRLSFALDFYKEKKNYPLPLLILGEKIEEVSSGQTLEDIVSKLRYLLPENISYGSFQQTLKRRKEPSLSVILKKLKKIELAEELNLDGENFLRIINHCGILLDEVFSLFKDLSEMPKECCLQGTITTSSIAKSGTPFINDTNPSVADLLDLIEEFRKGQFIIPGAESAPHYDIIQERWITWVMKHPAVIKYLDPAITLIQDAAVPVVPNLNVVMGMLPTFPGGLGQPAVIVDGIHGGNWEGLYLCPNRADSEKLALVLRSHYQHPLIAGPLAAPPPLGAPPIAILGNGQPNPPARILSFYIAPGSVKFW